MAATGPTWATNVRLALVGSRTDRLRFLLSAAGALAAAMLLLVAVNVVLIGGGGLDRLQRYNSAILDEPGLHQGVVVVMLGLTVPLMAFVGQCIRVGAPTRNQRLASFRMAGATAPEVARIVATETAISAGSGAIVGALVFAVARRTVASEPDGFGFRRWPTDVDIHLLAYVAVVVLVAGIAAGAALLSLRRSIIDPFGVTHRHETKAPIILPLVLLAAGLVGLAFWAAVQRALGLQESGGLHVVIGFVLFVTCAVGVTLGAAALGQQVARLVRPRVRGAASLLASARLEANPFRASRTLGVVLIAVMIAAGVQQFRVAFRLGTDPADTFYADTFDLLNLALGVAVIFATAGLLVAAAEGITERRRTLAALVAMGTPRLTIARSVLAETLLPLVPGVFVAAAAGTLASRGFTGSKVVPAVIATPESGSGFIQPDLATVGVPWLELGTLCGAVILAATIVTAMSLVLLPASTSPSELRVAA